MDNDKVENSISIKANVNKKYFAAELIIAAAIAAAHFIFVMSHFHPAISTVDANVYHVQAKLIATRGETSFVKENRMQYAGIPWAKAKDGRYVAYGPPGLSAMLAIPYRLIGPDAALYVNPVLAALALVGVFLLCRAWIGPWWALAGEAFVAMNPFFTQHALYGYSHIAVAFFLVWGLALYAGWMRTGSGARAFGAGLFLGFIVCIRYPEVIFLPAVAFCAWLYLKDSENESGGSYLAFIVGAAIPIAALAIRNYGAFGSALKTGYEITGLPAQSVFRIRFFLAYYLPYIQKLLGEGGGFVFALGITGMVAMAAKKETRDRGLLLLLLVVPLTLLYMSYFVRPHTQSMRFVLPLFPLYAVGAVFLLKELSAGRRGAAVALMGSALALTACWGLPLSANALGDLEARQRPLSRITRIVRENVPPGSILITEEGMCHQLDFAGNWKLIDTNVFSRNSSDVFTGTKGGAPMFSLFASEVAKWAGPEGHVYWLVAPQQMAMYVSRLPEGNKFDEKKQIKFTFRLPGKRAPRRDETGDPGRAGNNPMDLMLEDRMSRRDFLGFEAGPEATTDQMFSRYERAGGGILGLYEWKKIEANGPPAGAKIVPGRPVPGIYTRERGRRSAGLRERRIRENPSGRIPRGARREHSEAYPGGDPMNTGPMNAGDDPQR